MISETVWLIIVFLSTLSLRRATVRVCEFVWGVSISIHALLAESDSVVSMALDQYLISIHALLAESDSVNDSKLDDNIHFYPRSPCGERPIKGKPAEPVVSISIHALLAESDIVQMSI